MSTKQIGEVMAGMLGTAVALDPYGSDQLPSGSITPGANTPFKRGDGEK
jgi:hypothetical protein